MMNFKSQHKQDGVSFIELVLAIFIIGASVTSLLLLQGTSFSGLATISARLERIFLINEFLVQKAFDRAKKEKESDKNSEKKIINDPKTNISYELKKPNRESSLKLEEHIKIEKCVAEWDEFTTKMQETMITFLFKPESKKL